MVSLDAKDLRKLRKELEKDANDLRRELRAVIYEAAEDVRGEAIKSISRGSKSGYTYEWRGVAKGLEPDSFRKVKGKVIPVKIRNKPHTASAKGEAPASDTGNLVNSIRAKEYSGLRAEVTARAKYSGYLEDDLDRPFLEPAYEKVEPKLEREIEKAIERALR